MYERAIQFFQRHNRICIASHANPDGDAIGSTLALGMGLLSLGKQVTTLNADGVPRNLRFLPYSDRIVRNLNTGLTYDALVLVDCGQPHRAGPMVEDLARSCTPFIVDHHLLPGVDHEAHCIDPTAASTGAVVYRLLRTIGMWIAPEIANLVYCTLVVDTGHFRYTNTTPDVLRMAAELMEQGADPWGVASQLEENASPARLGLLRLMLETVELHERGRYATVILSTEMFREAGALAEDAEEFVNFPRSIAGVEVAALFRQQTSRRWKVSLRSKGEIDVAAITALFGGGGHEHAAGCTLEVDLATAKERISTEVRKALQRRKS